LIGPGARLGEGVAAVDETLRLLLRLGWSRPVILETYAVRGDDPIETLTHARAYVLEGLEGLEGLAGLERLERPARDAAPAPA
jgi:hypothetical protein